MNRPRLWQTLLAFATIYLVWGSTFLAIRIGVKEVPPFLLAALRFLLAGGVMVAWMRARGGALPTAREWRSAFQVSVPIFLLNYGLVFWAETRIDLPPIKLQREFARRVAASGIPRAAQRFSLAELGSLFASLQHRAFQGEL